MEKVKTRRKGYYFSLDAFLASALLLLGLLLLSLVYVSERSVSSNYFSRDSIRMLSSFKVYEVNNSYVQGLIQNGSIQDVNVSILEQVGSFWAQNRTEEARQLIASLQGQLIPDNYGFAVYVDGELVFSNNKSVENSLVVSKAIVSGISKSKPFRGYSSRLVLSSIDARTTSSYAYFGGFVGQGNISQRLVLSNISRLNEAYFEIDVSDNFSLYINSVYSGSYELGSPGKWQINDNYLSNFRNGTNLINITFNNSGFVSGGFLRITYDTSELNDSEIVYFQGSDFASRTEFLPGISGVINLYSSFHVPGNISEMNIYLHYSSDYLTYLTIGNVTVFSRESSGEQFANIGNAELSAKLDYSSLGSTTIPLRLGSGSGNQTITGEGTADVVLVNDVSGSMEWCSGTICTTSLLSPARYCGTNANYRPENGTYCDWTTEYYSLVNGTPVCSARWHAKCTLNDSRKIDIAANASNDFSGTVLNTFGNRIGFVEYTNQWNSVLVQNESWSKRFAPFPDSIAGRQNLTSNSSEASDHVNSYMDAYWGTCICCGVEAAVDMLTKLSNTSRKRSMVVMSDGEATDKCTGVGTGNAKEDAIKAAQDACTDYNITVYAVGFGADVDAETLMSMAACNGSYYDASNVSELSEIYRNIASNIVDISYSAQQANVSGSGSISRLYDDSYLAFSYLPETQRSNTIAITLETGRFSNNISSGILDVPENATLLDAKVLSFSGNRWTDNLSISGINAFNLASFGSDFTLLGDPFVVYAPVGLFGKGDNSIVISTAVAPGNYTGGSLDDMAVYTLNIDSSTGYTESLSSASGCSWLLDFENGEAAFINVPAGYNGSKSCYFANASFDNNDALDVSAFSLFQKLDVDNNGKINVILSQENINMDTAVIKGVPSLWGPVVMEARAWQ